jgi:hypothetical protein
MFAYLAAFKHIFDLMIHLGFLFTRHFASLFFVSFCFKKITILYIKD